MTENVEPNGDGPDGRSNADWMQQLDLVMPSTVRRDYDPKFSVVIDRGLGASVWDVAGKQYIDLTCGYSTTNLGHCFAPLVQAASRQMTQLTHLTGQPHPGQIELAQRLSSLFLPSQHSSVVFNSSGARAIESAWRAAVGFRPGNLLCISPGFHGKTLAVEPLSESMAAGGSIEGDRYALERAPASGYPYCQRCPLELEMPECSVACAEALLADIRRQDSQISAVLVEPALGARGYVFPPSEYFQRLRELTRELGIVLIADEIQTGLGRCGGWSLAEQQGWEPDLVVLGKSLGGGILPVSAVVGRREIMACIPSGSVSETFAGTPLACAVALEVLNQLEHTTVFRRGVVIGGELRGHCRDMFSKSIANMEMSIAGVGACCAIEFRLGGPISDDIKLAGRFANALLGAGLFVHHAGPARTRVVLLPPLNLTAEELAETRRRLTAAHATL